MLGFVSKNLPKIHVTILGKNLSLDIFSLRRLCLCSEIKIYAFVISGRKEKEVRTFKPRGANYAFSNIMQFWPHATYLFKRLLICLLEWFFKIIIIYFIFRISCSFQGSLSLLALELHNTEYVWHHINFHSGGLGYYKHGIRPTWRIKAKREVRCEELFFFLPSKQISRITEQKKKATAQVNFYNLTWTPDPGLRILDFIWYIFYQ